MTREIKFRAWDNQEKKFFEPTYEGYAGRIECLSITFAGRLSKRTFNQPAIDESIFEGRYVLNQFTELKDKNGKEIFEGDVVKDCYGEIGTVEMLNGSYKIVNKRKKLGFGSYAKQCEVLGNIYSNPELLK